MSEYMSDKEKTLNPPIAETDNMQIFHIENNLLIVIGEEEGELVISVSEQLEELRLLLDKAHGHFKSVNRKSGVS